MEHAGRDIRLNLVVYESIYVSIAGQRDGWGEAYQKKAAMVYLSPADMTNLQIRDGDRIEMTSESGSVVVAAEAGDDCSEGTGNMPFSLYSNRLASYDPGLSSLPNLRLIEARVHATTKGITPLSDLLIRRTVAQERSSTASDL
jgi:formylmethanofuran dehydrogenase subunit D